MIRNVVDLNGKWSFSGCFYSLDLFYLNYFRPLMVIDFLFEKADTLCVCMCVIDALFKLAPGFLCLCVAMTIVSLSLSLLRSNCKN